MKHIEGYFKAYPESKECFETNDKFLFHHKPDATAHAATLKDRSVIHHKRAEKVALKPVTTTAAAQTSSNGNPAESSPIIEPAFPEDVVEQALENGVNPEVGKGSKKQAGRPKKNQ